MENAIFKGSEVQIDKVVRIIHYVLTIEATLFQNVQYATYTSLAEDHFNWVMPWNKHAFFCKKMQIIQGTNTHTTYATCASLPCNPVTTVC